MLIYWKILIFVLSFILASNLILYQVSDMADWVCGRFWAGVWFRGSTSRHYCADSGSKLISTVQTLAPNKSLLRRLWLQTNLLRRFWLQTNIYCGDSGSKLISTAQTLAPNESLLRRLGLQMTSLTQDGSSHTEMYSLHFSIVEGSVDASFIFLQSMVHQKFSQKHYIH